MQMHLFKRPVLTIVGLATILAAVSGCNVQFSHDAEARDQWTRSYSLAQGGELEIRNTNGKVTIEATDGKTIEVTAARIVKAASDEAAKAELQRVEISESVSADRISLDATNKGLGFVFNLSRRVDFTIKVPQWANVTVSQTNGEVTLTGLTGRFKGESTNGRIQASGVAGDVEIRTTNGAIVLDFERLGANGVRGETTNGSINVTLPKDVAARISAKVTNGGISTSDLPLTVIEESRRRLEATIGTGGPQVKLETTNGAISIKGR
jgi:hypothetical protein